MRVSSVIRAPSSGTLKSARTSARLLLSSDGARSRTVRLFTFFFEGGLETGADVCEQVDAAARITPLVVVPPGEFHERAVDHVRALRIEDARRGIADVVARDELDFRVLQDSLQRPLGRR